MNTIQPIETKYKGYRFRSRLEARWAMFYDAIGVQWTYEPQPVRVDGVAYLPDFEVVFDGELYRHEVKSAHEFDRIKPRKVYLAGKMQPETNWRGGELNPVQSGYLTSDGMGWLNQSKQFSMNGINFENVGPFPVPCGLKHCCECFSWTEKDEHQHMSKLCSSKYEGGASAQKLLTTCVVTLQQADIVCAHIATADAFGTLVEIGLAKGSRPKRPLSLSIDRSLAISLRETLKPLEGDKPIASLRHDMWFAEQLADSTKETMNDEDARDFHSAFIRKYTAKELNKIASVGAATNAAFISFGDPLEIIEGSYLLTWGNGNASRRIHECRAEAEAVRAHRFDSF